LSEYYSDLRDLRFTLFDVLGVGSLSESERFAHADVELFDDVLLAADDQARELLHPLNESGDRKGVRLEKGRVITPEGWTEAYRIFAQMGWHVLITEPEIGGQGLPHVLHVAVGELFSAGNMSFGFTPGLTTGVIGLVNSFGPQWMRDFYLPKLVSGEWAGTMCLTEPGAGSAVPDLKSSATAIEGTEDAYKIKGQKIFISSGDHDFTDNIIHAFLARVEDDPSISLFLVPRQRPEGDGFVFNDVTTVGIEEKLGIHASPTCSLSFGDDDDCTGWLIGERGKGLRCMFQMMNGARLEVATQAYGLANLAYQRSVRYAKERVQGVTVQDLRKKDAARVAIIEHPDVRRMLMQMKALAEGARALGLYAGFCADRVEIAVDEKEQKRWHHQLEIITPIAKAWASDESFKVAELGIQVHGGYGYCSEYGMEQILRDTKITSLYEGTNGIQALDLLGRKVARGGGVMMMTMLNEVNRFLNGPAKDGDFAVEITALSKARDGIVKVAMEFAQRSMKGDIQYSALHASPFLQMFGDLLVCWRLLEAAVVASKRYDARLQKIDVDSLDEELGNVLQDDEEARFLHGKIATARFFTHQILPRVHARQMSIESDDRSALMVQL
jgi:alkylation response protein AidB-like acyl-CoA dehydrogenase